MQILYAFIIITIIQVGNLELENLYSIVMLIKLACGLLIPHDCNLVHSGSEDRMFKLNIDTHLSITS